MLIMSDQTTFDTLMCTGLELPRASNTESPIAHMYNPDMASIDVLNDDCLLHIFDFLNITELAKIQDVSERWSNLLLWIARSKYTELHLDWVLPSLYGYKSMAPEKLLKIVEKFFGIAEKLIRFVGPVVKKIYLASYHLLFLPDRFIENKLLELIELYCIKLESLDLNGTELCEDSTSIMGIFKTLITFHSYGTCFHDKEMLKYFEMATNLRKLSIVANSYFFGNSLATLNNLTKLKLNYCTNIKPPCLVSTLKLCKDTLKCLSIKRCGLLDNTVITTIITELKVLEKLSISNQYESITNLPDLAKCEKLTTLKIECQSLESMEPLLEALADHNQLKRLVYFRGAYRGNTIKYISQLTNLTHIELAFSKTLTDKDINALQTLTKLTHFSIPGCNTVTSKSILGLVKACPHICFVDVSFTMAYYDFVYKMLDILKAAPDRAKMMLVLYDTNVFETLKISKLMEDHGNRVELNFIQHTVRPQFYLDDSDDDYVLDFEVCDAL